MTSARAQLAHTIRLLEDLTRVTDHAEQVLTDEQHALDWHPASVYGDGTPKGTSDHTPVEQVVLKQADIRADLAQLADDRDTLQSIAEAALRYARTITARAPLPKVEVPRCNGKIDPLCTNAAATGLRDRNGSPVEETCERCFLAACPACYSRPADAWRKIVLDGREISGCEACARRQWRAARGAA